ncbi:MAG: hypothetical protein AAF919_12385 [Pseudomonadota bacterium]
MRILFAAILAVAPAMPTFADYRLELIDTGQRAYYCTATIRLTNATQTPLTELSGYFLLHIGNEQVGRSKGTWFLNVPAGGSADAVFETPNAPCESVDRYDYVIGACRFGKNFAAVEECAALIAPTAPVVLSE